MASACAGSAGGTTAGRKDRRRITELINDALTLTGARPVQVFTHGIIPSILPSLLGISLYRLDENIRSSLVLGLSAPAGSASSCCRRCLSALFRARLG